jgi:NAD(P)-dependent dehydrogenase (short-subunit alcohol dehydrogenase family)
MEINSQVALVTGAGSGIGLATARMLAERGAFVGLVDLNGEKAEEASLLINTELGRAASAAFQGNVANETDILRVFDSLESMTAERATILVTAAGITDDGYALKVDKETMTVKRFPISRIQRVIEINLVACVVWSQEFARRIRQHQLDQKKPWQEGEKRTGKVVLISSICSQGNPGQVGYAASKAALPAVASTLSQEWADFGIHCSVVSPGFTLTPMIKSMKPAAFEAIRDQLPLGRFLEPEEIAHGIISSIENDAIAGNLDLSGGHRLGQNHIRRVA